MMRTNIEVLDQAVAAMRKQLELPQRCREQTNSSRPGVLVASPLLSHIALPISDPSLSIVPPHNRSIMQKVSFPLHFFYFQAAGAAEGDNAYEEEASPYTHLKHIQCLGTDARVPEFLRAQGQVAFKHMNKGQAELLVKEVWSLKSLSA